LALRHSAWPESGTISVSASASSSSS
jgi:hypothetical protein